VSGLSNGSTSLVLQNNGGNNLSTSKNGSFTFATPLFSGNSYNVTVFSQPDSPAQTCTVGSGSGTIMQSNVSATVTCSIKQNTQMDSIGGTVSGLQGTGLMLQLNGVNANGPFTFSQQVAQNGTFVFTQQVVAGSNYVVTVAAYPTGETCGVTNAAGTAGNTDITNLLVACTVPSGTVYTVGGKLTWTPGSGVLSVNDNSVGCSPAQITSSGQAVSFSCSNTAGVPYNVTATLVSVSPQLPNGYSYSCTVANGSGPPPQSGNVTGVSITCAAYPVQTGTAVGYWGWILGSSSTNTPVSNNPDPRSKAASWTDSKGIFWLFGGTNYGGYCNDLWQLTGNTNPPQWSLAPAITIDPTKPCNITPTAAQWPSARSGPATWVDSAGNFWMFGGNSANGNGFVPDFWMYTVSTNTWSLVTQNYIDGTCASAPAQCPGGRYLAATWVDTSGNMWMFGGSLGGSNVLNDMWEFTPTAGSSAGTWKQPPGGGGGPCSATLPCAREEATTWTDPSSGQFYLFGGCSTCALSGPVFYSGLWEYNPTSNQWSLVSGNPDTSPNFENTTEIAQGQTGSFPGARGGAASWSDGSKNFWLFSGNSPSGSPNDLWMYTPSSGQWTYEGVTGIPGTATASYGTQGSFAASNQPPGRGFSVAWFSSSVVGGTTTDNLWLFGGAAVGGNYFNDLWEFASTVSGQ
jgi:hypothetical protein